MIRQVNLTFIEVLAERLHCPQINERYDQSSPPMYFLGLTSN